MRFLLCALFISNFSFAAEVVIPKVQFVEGFKKGLPDAFCGEKTYFRKCFENSAESCAKLVTEAGTSCFTALDAKLPAQFHQPADGQTWGEKIGNCVGQKFETESAKNKKTTVDCKDPAKWK